MFCSLGFVVWVLNSKKSIQNFRMNLNMYLNWNYIDKYLYLLKICYIYVYVFISNSFENKWIIVCIELNLLIVMVRLSFFLILFEQ